MLHNFRCLISLKKIITGLCAPFRPVSVHKLSACRCAGQIATILIVILVAILIFILVTLNIGTVSGTVLMVTNAVDAAGMGLGSQLASRSHYLYEQLGGTSQCVRGGWLGVVLAVIAAVATWWAGGAAGWVILAAAVAGAIGQTIIHGTPQAALQGAIMGAVIGICFLGGMTAGYAVAPGTAPIEGLVTQALISEAGAAVATAAFSGAILSASAAAYSAGVMLDTNTAAMDALSKALNALPEYTSLRENVFLQALSQSADDPTKAFDTYDLDNDEDTGERVTYFENWFHEHTEALVNRQSKLPEQVNDFLTSVFIPFYEKVRLELLPMLDRKEIECLCTPDGDPGNPADGAESQGINLLRRLYDCGYILPSVGGFPSWIPGPERDALLAWYCADSPSASAPAGWDRLDWMRYKLEEFVNYGRGLLNEKEDECGIYYDYDPKALAKALKAGSCLEESDWWDDLYCPDSWGSEEVDDWYTVLAESADIFDRANKMLMEIRDDLPGCQLRWGVYEEEYLEQGDPLCQCPVPVFAFGSANMCEEVYPCYWTDETIETCGPDNSPSGYTWASPGWGGEEDPIQTSYSLSEICGLQEWCWITPPPECQEGVHFNNPPCRLYEEDQTRLRNEIAFLRDYVANLETHIRDLYFCSGDPCTTVEGDVQFDPASIPPFVDLTPEALRTAPTECGPEFEVCHLCPPAVVSEEPGTGAASDTEIQLGWTFDPSLLVTSIEIYRAGELITTLSGAANEYLDTGLLPETTYLYEIMPYTSDPVTGAPVAIESAAIFTYVQTASEGWTGAECVSGIEDITITIDKVCLYSTAHEPCSADVLGTGEGRLRVLFTYELTCSCCTGVENPELPPPEPDPEDPPVEGEEPVEPPPIIAPAEPIMETRTIQGQAWGVICLLQVPDIDLNVVGRCEGDGDCLTQEEFLDHLGGPGGDNWVSFSEYMDNLEVQKVVSECDDNPSRFATVDRDIADEFSPLISTFCSVYLELNPDTPGSFLNVLPSWNEIFGNPVWDTSTDLLTDPNCESAITSGINEVNGRGCLRYDWEDTRGQHSIKVSTGPFVFAWLRKTKSGNFLVNKECVRLTDYCDNMSGCSGRHKMASGSVWVQINRVDTGTTPALPSTGTVNLGLKWYTAAPTGAITRKSKPAYTYNFVGVGGIRD